MTGDEYRAAIARLGLSQVQAATFLGIGERTSRRWAQKGCTDWEQIRRLRLLVRLDLPSEAHTDTQGADFLMLLVRFGVSPGRAEELVRDPIEVDITP